MVYRGGQNLPLFVAQEEGFFLKRGLSVDLINAPNADEAHNIKLPAAVGNKNFPIFFTIVFFMISSLIKFLRSLPYACTLGPQS